MLNGDEVEVMTPTTPTDAGQVSDESAYECPLELLLISYDRITHDDPILIKHDGMETVGWLRKQVRYQERCPLERDEVLLMLERRRLPPLVLECEKHDNILLHMLGCPRDDEPNLYIFAIKPKESESCTIDPPAVLENLFWSVVPGSYGIMTDLDVRKVARIILTQTGSSSRSGEERRIVMVRRRYLLLRLRFYAFGIPGGIKSPYILAL